MTKPIRIKRKRAGGWRMPPNTVYVGRPSRWGNPYIIDDILTPYKALRMYKAYLNSSPSLQAHAQATLQGKNLACWCEIGDLCHADVLLEIANRFLK